MTQTVVSAGLLSPRYVNTQSLEQALMPKGGCLVDVTFSFMPELNATRRKSFGRVRTLGPLEMWRIIEEDENSRKLYYYETQSLLELLVNILDSQFDNDMTKELYQLAQKRIKQWQDKYNLKRNQRKCLSEHDKVSKKLDILYEHFEKSETAKPEIKNGGNRALVILSYAIEDNRRGALKDLCALPHNTILC